MGLARRARCTTFVVHPLHKGPLCPALGLAALALTACVSMPTAARDSFVKSVACPPERVTVAPAMAPAAAAPPPDVAADPGRLRIWASSHQDVNRDWTFFDVNGCGQHQRIKCSAGGDLCLRDFDLDGKLAALRASLPPPPPPEFPSSAGDDARLASLPHLAQRYDVPAVPAALHGLSVRLRATILGATSAAFTVGQAQRECVAGVESYCSLLGWMVVTDPNAPADLDIEFHCNGHVTPTLRGTSLEIRMPDEPADATTRFLHAGSVVETLPRGPSDFVCDSSGSPVEVARDCVDRARQFARTRFIGDVAKSDALRHFAERVHERALP